MEDNGILYIATGEEYILEAETSARSVREQMPGVPIAIATDTACPGDVFDERVSLEDLPAEKGASLIYPEITPFEKTIFLDTDTYVCEDVSELFDILDYYDIAVAHAPNWQQAPETPEAYVEYNTGVVAYSDTSTVNEFLAEWESTYRNWKASKDVERVKGNNQPAFTKAVHEADISPFVLSKKYNCRVASHPGFLGRDEVKIVHGRHPAGLPALADQLNADPGEYAVYYNNSTLDTDRPLTLKNQSLRYTVERYALSVVRSVREDGVYETSKKVLRYVS